MYNMTSWAIVVMSISDEQLSPTRRFFPDAKIASEYASRRTSVHVGKV